MSQSTQSPNLFELGEEFLEHHGVKGQKWGVRNQPSRVVKTGKTQYSKAPHRLSDNELKSRINRMNLEKQYSDLKKKPPNKGAKATSAFLSRVGGQVAATVLTAGALFAISKIIESKFGVKIPRL